MKDPLDIAIAIQNLDVKERLIWRLVAFMYWSRLHSWLESDGHQTPRFHEICFKESAGPFNHGTGWISIKDQGAMVVMRPKIKEE